MTPAPVSFADVAWATFTVSLALAELLVALLDERHGGGVPA